MTLVLLWDQTHGTFMFLVFGWDKHDTGICILYQISLWIDRHFRSLCLSFCSWIRDQTALGMCWEHWDEQFDVAQGIVLSAAASGGFFPGVIW